MDIKEVFDNGQIILGVLITSFTVLKAVNYIGVTDLEIQIMTKYQKLKNYIVIALLLAFPFTLAFYRSKIIKELVINFLVMFVVVTLALLLVWIINIVFSIKPKFEIKIKDEEGKWHLRRMISDEKALLVHSEQNNKYLISNLENAIFMRNSIEETKRVKALYQTKTLGIKIVMFILLYSFTTGMIYLFLFYWFNQDIDGNKPIAILFPFIALISVLLSHVFYFINKKYYNEYLEYKKKV
ncbi:hypothetical protein [Sporosarcina koreensis]|uniref:hypothetical protein n=1 Tax=Sporosarcina koreensis TaxID=334735 RepID=UPI000759B7E6|nr:hypothetical protein [Sporosarcina koreensis]